MKKLTSLILVLAMLVSVFSFSAFSVYAEGEDSTESLKNQQTIQILKTLGIGNSFFASYNETATMTRRQYCILMKDFLGKSFGATSNLIPFDDVMDYDPDIAVLRTMSELGFMYGFDDNTFRPDSEVTYEDAITVMVNMLGYTLPAESKGGYPMGYLAVAAQEGLIEGVNPVSGKAITQGDIITLLSNFIDIEVLEQVSFGDDGKFQAVDNETILAKRFNVYKGNGIVNGTFVSMLDRTSALTEDKVQISQSTLYINGTNANDYFGYDVEYYYEMNKKGISKLLAIYPSDKNKELVIDNENFEPLSGTTLTYYDVDKDKIRYQDIEFNTVMIYNGAYRPFDRSLIDPAREGYIKFLDNNADGKCDILFVNHVDYIVVKNIDRETNTIYSKYPMQSGNSYVRLDDDTFDIRYTIKDTNGLPYEISKIKENDVLRVIESQPSSRERVYDIEVSTNFAIGTITSLEGAVPDYDYVYVDDKEYKITSMMNWYFANNYISPFKLGEKVGLLLDKTGEVVTYLVATNEDATDISSMIEAKFKGNLGYMLEHGYVDNSMRSYYIEFVDSKGAKVETSFADEFKFMYYDSSVSYDGNKSYKVKSTEFTGGIRPIIETAFNNSRFVFRYELDADGKINEMEIATDASSNQTLLAPNRLSYVTAIDAIGSNTAQRIYKKMWVKNNSISNEFYRPASGATIMGIAEIDDQIVTNIASDFSSILKYYSTDGSPNVVSARPPKTYFYCYGENDNEIIYAHYAYQRPGIKTYMNSSHGMTIIIESVKKISKVINEVDEEIIKIKGYKIDDCSEQEVLIRDLRPASQASTPLQFYQGELIAVAKSSDGYVVIDTQAKANYINNASINTSANTTATNNSALMYGYPLWKAAEITSPATATSRPVYNMKYKGSMYDNMIVMYGYPVSIQDGRLYMKYNGTASSIDEANVTYFELGSEQVIVYDSAKKTVKAGTIDDLITVEFGGTGRDAVTPIYLKSDTVNANVIIVFK